MKKYLYIKYINFYRELIYQSVAYNCNHRWIYDFRIYIYGLEGEVMVAREVIARMIPWHESLACSASGAWISWVTCSWLFTKVGEVQGKHGKNLSLRTVKRERPLVLIDTACTDKVIATAVANRRTNISQYSYFIVFTRVSSTFYYTNFIVL